MEQRQHRGSFVRRRTRRAARSITPARPDRRLVDGRASTDAVAAGVRGVEVGEQAGEPLDGLVEGVRRGDRDAIAAVYLELGPSLRGFLLRRVAHGEVADDLVEQTFVELIEGGHRINGDGRALRAWLYRAARNNLLDWRKRAERRSDQELTEGALAGSDAGEPGADEQVVAGMVDPALLTALARLTSEQREVIELRLVAGLTVAEVAAITGRSAGAVKQLQHRGIRRLVILLTPDAREQTDDA
ncbi:MAG: RNA polymerase sigma factor [Nitriliruptor sp.]|nr:MAG: RNA polymerase sigma factor [Nitriliruptor sp.]